MNKNEERGEAGFNWPVVIKNPNARASLDYYYGPYESEDDMRSSVPNELWVPGFTAAVQSGDGSVEEWWVQGEGAGARFVRKHDTAPPDGNMRFMGYAGRYDDLLAKESPSKGDVWQVAEKDGRHTIYPLYVYDGTEWAPLARNFTLTVKTPDGTSKRYDGSEAVTVDLSGVATRQDVADSKAEAAKTYATIESLDGLATWQDGDYTLLGKRLDSHQVCFRTPQGSWAPTGVTAGTNNITLAGGGAGLRLMGKEVGMARNWGAYYRANPLVLAVRVTDLNFNYSYTILEFYNPFNLTLSCERYSEGVFKFTHNLTAAKVSRVYGATMINDDTIDADSRVTYMALGDANTNYFNYREHLLFSVLQRRFDSFDFRTAANKCHDFNTLDLFIFDFSPVNP